MKLNVLKNFPMKLWLLFLLAFSFTSLAQEKTEITSIELSCQDMSFNIGERSYKTDISSLNEDLYSVKTSVTNIPKSGEYWSESSVPELRLQIDVAKSGLYSFSELTSQDISIENLDYTVKSIKRSASRVIFLIELPQLGNNDYTHYTELGIDTLTWDRQTGISKWTRADDAESYEVKLYLDSECLGTVYTSDNSFNFSYLFLKGGYYSFTVQSLTSSGLKGQYRKSDACYFSPEEASLLYQSSTVPESLTQPLDSLSQSLYSETSLAVPGGYFVTDTNTWYLNPDGSHPYGGFSNINGKWYYFDESGFMKKDSWIKWKDNYYYTGSDGVLLFSQMTPDGYYVNEAGIWDEGKSSNDAFLVVNKYYRLYEE